LNTSKSKFGYFTAILLLSAAMHNASAATLIDNFTDFQVAENGTDGPLPIFGTDLVNAYRTLTAEANPTDADTEVAVESGMLTISNSTDSNGTASILYSFDPINLMSVADALLLNIGFIDLSFEIQVIANGLSVFDFHNFGGTGQHAIAFSDFTNPSSFGNLSSLQLNFRGVEAWDAQIDLMAANRTGTQTNTVPEPTTWALLIIGMFYLRQMSVKPALSKLS